MKLDEAVTIGLHVNVAGVHQAQSLPREVDISFAGIFFEAVVNNGADDRQQVWTGDLAARSGQGHYVRINRGVYRKATAAVTFPRYRWCWSQVSWLTCNDNNDLLETCEY